MQFSTNCCWMQGIKHFVLLQLWGSVISFLPAVDYFPTTALPVMVISYIWYCSSSFSFFSWHIYWYKRTLCISHENLSCIIITEDFVHTLRWFQSAILTQMKFFWLIPKHVFPSWLYTLTLWVRSKLSACLSLLGFGSHSVRLHPVPHCTSLYVLNAESLNCCLSLTSHTMRMLWLPYGLHPTLCYV